MEQKYLILNGIKWHITAMHSSYVNPLCPKHYLGLNLVYNGQTHSEFKCEECDKTYSVPRSYSEQREYVIDKIKSIEFKKMKFINLDDEIIPLAESKNDTTDEKYFVKAKLVDSKIGKRLIVYAGEKGKADKTQIFAETDIKRLAFDQNDINPSEIFVLLEGTFGDGTKHQIKRKE